MGYRLLGLGPREWEFSIPGFSLMRVLGVVCPKPTDGVIMDIN